MARQRVSDEGHLRWFDTDEEYYTYIRARKYFDSAEDYDETRSQFRSDAELLNWLEEQERIQAFQDEVEKRVRRRMIWIKIALWPIVIILIWAMLALSKEIDNGLLSIILPIIWGLIMIFVESLVEKRIGLKIREKIEMELQNQKEGDWNWNV